MFEKREDNPEIKTMERCKNHSVKSGNYFVSEVPWIKYCQSCALNIALCGKKIEKELTTNEIYNKVAITDQMTALSQTVKQCDNYQRKYMLLSNCFQKTRNHFSTYVKQIDQNIERLMKYKGIFEQLIHKQIEYEIKQIFQRQNQIIARKMEITGNINKLQGQFTNLLNKSHTEIDDYLKGFKQNSDKCRQLFYSQNYISSLLENIVGLSQKFTNNRQELNVYIKTTISANNDKHKLQDLLKNFISIDKTENISANSNKQNDSTCPSTVRNSGILIEQNSSNANRRASRANCLLQLRSKTKTKSITKKSTTVIDVLNVVEQIQPKQQRQSGRKSRNRV